MVSLSAKRSNLVRRQPRDANGRFASTGSSTSAAPTESRLSKLKRLAAKHPGLVTEGVVGLGGLAGEAVGKHIGASVGLEQVGGYAGDLLGSIAARYAVNGVTAVHTAQQKLKRDEAFAQASKLQKAKMLVKAAHEEHENAHRVEKMKDGVAEDATGWAIGNVADKALGAFVPASNYVPFRGSLVAMATVPKVAPHTLRGASLLKRLARKRAAKMLQNRKKEA